MSRAIHKLLSASLLALASVGVATADVPPQMQPSAGSYTGDWKYRGNGLDSQARWTRTERYAGGFSMMLAVTGYEPGVAYPFAQAIIRGFDGKLLSELGGMSYVAKGSCDGGAPRVNIFTYDVSGVAQTRFIECNRSGVTAEDLGDGWFKYSFSPAGIFGAGEIVRGIRIVVDINKTVFLDDVTINSGTEQVVVIGEPSAK